MIKINFIKSVFLFAGFFLLCGFFSCSRGKNAELSRARQQSISEVVTQLTLEQNFADALAQVQEMQDAVDITGILKNYEGVWHMDADSPDYLNIESIDSEIIKFEFRIFGITTVSGTAVIENGEIKYSADKGFGNSSGTMIFYNNVIKLIVEKDDVYPPGHIFDFNVRGNGS